MEMIITKLIRRHITFYSRGPKERLYSLDNFVTSTFDNDHMREDSSNMEHIINIDTRNPIFARS
jgi:hypothetical protein